MLRLKRLLHRHIKRHWATIHKHAKDHFVPHRGNNHHPHVLKHHVLIGYSVILILLKVIAVIGPIALPSSSLYSSAITPKNIIDLTNQTRENLDLSKLKENNRLNQAAAAKAADMLKNQYFAHTSPSGITPWDWIINAGYVYHYSGENLAVHFEEAEDVAAGWLASASHRANIVNPNYIDIGVGVANGVFEGATTTFVVQMFGAPSSKDSAPVLSGIQDTDKRLLISPPAILGKETGAVPSAGTDEIEIQKITKQPVIDEGSLTVKPRSDSYDVRLQVDNADSVAVSLGNEQVLLSRAGASSIWQGQIDYDNNALNQSGEALIISAVSNGAPPFTRPLALVAPGAAAQKFYVFNEGTDKYAKFFGFLKVGNLNDKVRQFYIGFIVFLAAALLLNFFALRFRLRHPSVLKHAVAVMGLTLFLIAI